MTIPNVRRWSLPTRSRTVLVTAVIALLPLVGCSSEPEEGTAGTDAPAGAEPPARPPGDSSSSGDDTPVKVTMVAQLPALATALASVPDGDEYLVGDRSGVVRRIRRVPEGDFTVPKLDEQSVLDLSKSVTTEFDRGFLNMALVNDGTSLVVMYTGPQGELRIEQYPYQPGNEIDVEDVRVLAATSWDYPFHHGGGLQLNESGDLLIGLGDKGLPVTQLIGADSDLVLAGVTSVPKEVLGDPDLAWAPTTNDMLARGLRNPWRLSLDPQSGDVFVGDVGNLDYEEVNRITSDNIDAGSNPDFGHPYFEGPLQISESVPKDLDLLPPVLARSHDEGACGMVAGYMYRDGPITPLDDTFLYADLCQLELRGFALGEDGTATDDRVLSELPESLVSFGLGPDDQVFGLGSSGGIYRVDPSWWSAPDHKQAAVGPAGEVGPVAVPVDIPEFCQVIDELFQAIEPLDAVSGMSPATLRSELESANEQIERLVPLLPADLEEPGATMTRVFRRLQEQLELADYDTSDPSVKQVFDDLINTTGEFADFPDAIVAFSTAGCM